MSRNRYVGDYRLVENIDARGRIRTTYEYIGKPYRFESSAGDVTRARGRVGACCAAGWVAWVAALIPESAAGRTLYAALPFAFIALPLGLMTATLVETWLAKPPFEHRHADRLENRAPATSFFTALLAIVAVLGAALRLLIGGGGMPGDIAFISGALVLAGCGVIAHRQWKRLRLIEA